MKDKLRSWQWLLAPVLVGLALRAAWAIWMRPVPVSDFAWYFNRAKSIAEGSGYAIDGVPTAFWPVGYPGTLGIVFAVFGSSLIAAKVLNLVCAGGVIALTGVLGKRLGLPQVVGLLAAWVMALHPNSIAYVSLVSAEPLSTLVLLAAVERHIATLEGHSRAGIWAGLLYGWAVLCKPHVLLVPIVLSLISSSSRRWRTLLALSIGLIVVLPWCLRNSIVFGQPVFISTNGGYNLLIGANPKADGRWMEVRTEAETGPNEAEYDRAFTRKALSFIASAPLHYLSLAPYKVRNLFWPGNEGIHWTVTGLAKLDPDRRHVLGLAKPLASSISVGLALAAFIGFLRWRRHWGACALAVIPLIFMLVAAIFFGESRFIHPALPCVVLLAALAITSPEPRSPESDAHPKPGGDRSSTFPANQP